MSDVIERRRIIADHGKVAFYNDQTILLRDVRCSYPHLDRPTAMGDGEPRYSMEAMIPDTPEYRPGIRALMQAIEQVARDNKTAAAARGSDLLQERQQQHQTGETRVLRIQGVREGRTEVARQQARPAHQDA
jgi:hypothetical protein